MMPSGKGPTEGENDMSATEKMRNHLQGMLDEIDERIANFDMNHEDINGFIHKTEQLRAMKQRRQGIVNAIATL